MVNSKETEKTYRPILPNAWHDTMGRSLLSCRRNSEGCLFYVGAIGSKFPSTKEARKRKGGKREI